MPFLPVFRAGVKLHLGPENPAGHTALSSDPIKRAPAWLEGKEREDWVLGANISSGVTFNLRWPHCCCT